ncbi:hypothetical protein OAO01_02735 [Oligoflexia bacterium]|nr:hypothetical protein [Oligoflexia bacterium]
MTVYFDGRFRLCNYTCGIHQNLFQGGKHLSFMNISWKKEKDLVQVQVQEED